jgi:AcrR family transcriptional regulator
MRTLTREDFAQGGLELLAESGVRGVTVATVCERLGVTKGSFYHHFGGIADLQQAMIDHWVELYGHARPAAVEALSIEKRLDALVDAAARRDHRTEVAIRTWSQSDERVAAAQRRLDDLRTAFMADTLVTLGVPSDRARTLAEMALALQTGFQARTGLVDRRVVRAAIEEWRTFLRSAVAEATNSVPTKGQSRGKS